MVYINKLSEYDPSEFMSVKRAAFDKEHEDDLLQKQTNYIVSTWYTFSYYL